ncbi:MAG: NAD(P)/FAD-dependent oxidoreductase [Cyanobium sp.]
MSQDQRPPTRTVIVVGAGVVGLSCAWWLQRRGHRVLLVDPARGEGGSTAALGVLMAQVFHRSSGRAWRLRQQSLALWRAWRQELAGRGRPIAWREGLLLLAADAQEAERLRWLQGERARQGIGLEWWGPEQVERLTPPPPGPTQGGLYSPVDGQLDPAQAMEAFHSDATAAGLTSRNDTVAAVERSRGAVGWQVVLASGQRLEAEWLVLCAGAGSGALLAPLLGQGGGAAKTGELLEPVLGQALELELPAAVAAGSWSWPGALVWQGTNLVPRPDLPGGRRFWLGATLEPGRQGDPGALEELRQLGGRAPAWLGEARERRRWEGLRARPVGRPAPWLEEVAPGLLVATGHYRNGVLLAPATAAWVGERVEGGSGMAFAARRRGVSPQNA